MAKTILIINEKVSVIQAWVNDLTFRSVHQVLGAVNPEKVNIILRREPVHVLVVDYNYLRNHPTFVLEKLHSEFPQMGFVVILPEQTSMSPEQLGYLSHYQVLKEPVNTDQLSSAINATLRKLADAYPSAPEPLDTKAEGFSGQVDQFTLTEIIQMFCLRRSTGKLSVISGKNSGVLFLERGNIIHAACHPLVGEGAVFEIFQWDHGQFKMEENIRPDRRTIFAVRDQIILEGLRRKSEGRFAVEPRRDSLLGALVGPYRVDDIVGAGPWGTVYLGHPITGKRKVALRVLNSDLQRVPQNINLFIKLGQVLISLQHPSVIATFEVGESAGVIYHVMEYFDGISLMRFKNSGEKLSPVAVSKVMANFLRVETFLKQNKWPAILVGPTKILLQPSGESKICDLLSAKPDQVVSTYQEVIRHFSHQLLPLVNNYNETPEVFRRMYHSLLEPDLKVDELSLLNHLLHEAQILEHSIDARMQ